MGSHPYSYFVPYQPDINAALQALRQREFKAGRYHPAMAFPAEGGEGPGAAHETIEEAIEAAGAEGTRSILDLQTVAEEQEYCAAAPAPKDDLEAVYGTSKPTREMIEGDDSILEMVERGCGIYIVLYRGKKASEIYFAGYSFD